MLMMDALHRWPGPPINQEVCIAFAEPFEIHITTLFEFEGLSEAPVSCFGDLDPSWLASALQPARHVHRPAPIIVGGLLATDHASDDRSRVDPNPKLNRDPETLGEAWRFAHQREGKRGHILGGVSCVVGRARDCHVGVADRLHLFDVMLGREFVDAQKHGAEHFH
jgi:hypothetical protein